MELYKTIIITIFLLGLLMIGAVNAASDNNDTLSDITEKPQTHTDDQIDKTINTHKDIQSETTDTPGIKSKNTKKDVINTNNKTDNEISQSNEDTLNADDGTFTTLQSKINAAEENSTIKLENDYSYNSGFTKDGITISKSITIDGNGKAINGIKQTRAFNITSNVVLKNIQFINCKISSSSSSFGGAIYCTGNNNSILNCTFTNCTTSSSSRSSSSFGGAIYCNGSHNTSIINCTFTNCTTSSSSKYSFNYGGAIYCPESNNSILNCAFMNCSSISNDENSYSYGGAIYCPESNNSILNCSFINCKSTYNYIAVGYKFRGGAIYSSKSNDVIINCTFTNCYTSMSTFCYGGAIYCNGSHNSSIINCTFTNCSSSSDDGGAISCEGSNKVNYYIINCYFINCSSSYGGGAISGSGNYNASIINCTFTNCSSSSGGAIYCTGSHNASIINCTFTNCSSSGNYAGGAICSRGSSSSYTNTISIINCTFTNCFSSSSSGGAISCEGSNNNYYIINCYFINCSSSYGGGAIRCGSSMSNTHTVSIINCTFTNCSSSSSTSGGGAISGIGSNNNYYIINCTFTNCSSTNSGAAIYGTGGAWNDNSNYYITNCTFIAYYSPNYDNSSNYDSAIYCLGNKYIVNCTLIKLNTTITVLFNNLTAGNVNITINLNNATGLVTLFINNKYYNKTLSNSTANFYIQDLPSGKYDYIINYFGDLNFNSSKYIGNLSINLQKSNIAINSYPIFVGEVAIINYNINYGATGIFSVYLNDTFVKNVTVGDYIELYDLAIDNYTVKVVYSGDRYFTNCENITKLEVLKKYDSSVSVTKNSLIAGNTRISITLDNDVTGFVSLIVNNKTYDKILSSGKATWYIYDLPSGKYNYTIIYSGNYRFNSFTYVDNLSIQIKQTDFRITSSDGIYVGDVANIKYTISSGATGIITVYLNDSNVKNVTVGTNGNTIKLYDLANDIYNIKLVYNSDGYFASSQVNSTFKVSKKESNLKITSSDGIYVGDVANINYSIASGATGIIHIYLNDSNVKNVTVGSNIELDSLVSGKYNIKLVYNSDSYFASSQATSSFEVYKHNLTVNFTKKPNNPIAGESVTLIFTLNPDVTGYLLINNESMKIENGQIIINIPKIKPNKYTYNLNYAGDSKYNPINKTYTFNVSFKDSNISLNLNNTWDYDESIFISPIVNQDAKGSFSISVTGGYDNIHLDRNIDVGQTLTLSSLTKGNYDVTVNYSGDDYYAPNNITKSFRVNGLESTCKITGHIEIDNSATIYVTLNEDAIGSVYISVNGNSKTSTLYDGVATFNIPNLPAGNYSIYIHYSGDSKYNSFSKYDNLEITLKPANIDLIINNVLKGNSASVRFEITNGATGTVRIYLDDNYQKTLNITETKYTTIYSSSLGKHRVKAIYSGDDYHQPSETITAFSVFQKYPIEVSKTAIIYGSGKQFHATFYDEYGNPLQNHLVAFRVDERVSTVWTDNNGVATYNIDNLGLGTYSIASINTYVTNEELVKTLKIFTSIQTQDMIRPYNTGVDFNVTLFDDDAYPLTNGYAIFNVNGNEYTELGDKNGVAKLNIPLDYGTYTITTTNGRTLETRTNTLKIVPTVYSDDMTRAYNSGIDYQAKFLDENANPLNKQKITFNVYSFNTGTTKNYTVTTDTNGIAILNEKLTVGEYSITSINLVTGEKSKNPNELHIIERIIGDNNYILKGLGQDAYYKVRVHSDDGGFVGEGTIISLTIKGTDSTKYYTANTNKQGLVEFNILDEYINNTPGKYEITAQYKEYLIKNIIYVLKQDGPRINIILDDINYGQTQNININLDSTFNPNAKVRTTITGENGYAQVYTNPTSSLIRLTPSNLEVSKYTVKVEYYDLINYKYNSNTKTFNVLKIDPRIITAIDNANVGEEAKITINIPNISGNINIKVGNYQVTRYLELNGVIIEKISLPAGVYNVEISYGGDFNYNPITKIDTLTITQPRIETRIISNDINMDTNTGNTLIATLYDMRGKPLVNKPVSIYFNGLNRLLTTDNNGQVNLVISGLVANTYYATVSFAGDNNYLSSSVNVKITVTSTTQPSPKKLTTKITAKKKTFKSKVKIKKYTATLKSGTKGVSKVWIYLTLKGKKYKKTFKAKTNNKGKATFKINNLNKKGTYTATIKYKGNKKYKASKKTVKIIIK